MAVFYGRNTVPEPAWPDITIADMVTQTSGMTRHPLERSMTGMAIMNTENLGAMLIQQQKMLDPENRAKAMQQAADETNRALSSANDALQTGQVTLELSKDVAPLMTHMKAVSAKLELIDQRLQAIENKPERGCSCPIS